MSRYVLSPEAAQDLNDILEYIAADSLETARRIVAELKSAMMSLVEHPHMGHLREDLASEPIRFWSVYSYLILYRAETRPMQVIRVLHGAQDVRSILEGGTKNTD